MSEDRKALGLNLIDDIKRSIVSAKLTKISVGQVVSATKEYQLSEAYRKSLRIKTPSVDYGVRKLSGGNQQKVVLAKWMFTDPDLLILDEPTTGVDPLSRRQFWELIEHIRSERLGMSVLIATAYMEEAARFDWLVAMNAGHILATGAPQEILTLTGAKTLEEAFIALLPQAQRDGYQPVITPPTRLTQSGKQRLRLMISRCALAISPPLIM